MHRHGRQTKLAEVGQAGQARIAAAQVEVRAGGLAGEVAVRYLAGAGVGGMRVRTESLAALAHAIDPTIDVEVFSATESEAGEDFVDPNDLRDPAAYAVAQGAYLALSLLRRAIDGAL
jgi:hypothetical protein